MNSIHLEFSYTEKEHAEQMAETLKRFNKRGHWIFIFILGIVLTTASVVSLATTSAKFTQVLFPLSFGIIFIQFPLYFRRLIKGSAKKTFKDCSYANQLVSWNITPEKLSFETPDKNLAYNWSLIKEVQEKPSAFLLFFQPKMPTRIPKTAFSSVADMETFRAFVRDNQIKLS